MTVSVVVAGVSGVGKSSIAAELVRRTGWVFQEGDDLHPPENKAKMAAGHALTDEDRAPWLRAVAAWIGEQEAAGRNAVLTCSALRRTYRDVLCDGHRSVWFAQLTADDDTVRTRIGARKGHYMPASLLDSQLALFEPLDPDEPGKALPAESTPAAIADEVLAAVER